MKCNYKNTINNPRNSFDGLTREELIDMLINKEEECKNRILRIEEEHKKDIIKLEEAHAEEKKKLEEAHAKEKKKLEEECNLYVAKCDQQVVEIVKSVEQLNLAKRKIYGKSSESSKKLKIKDKESCSSSTQTLAGVEADSKEYSQELQNSLDAMRVNPPLIKAKEKIKPAGRTPKDEGYENLKKEDVTRDIKDKTCPECGGELKFIGEKLINKMIEKFQAYKLLREKSKTYKCTNCKKIFNASTSKPFLKGCDCSPSLLSDIARSRYEEHLPIERICNRLAMEFSITKNTIMNWLIKAAETYIKPVYEAILERLKKGIVIHVDETPIDYLNPAGEKSVSKNYFWCYTSGRYSDVRLVYYDFTSSRSGENPLKVLNGFTGYITCDGFDGYNKLTEVIRCGCMAHLRRKFVEVAHNKEIPSGSILETVLNFIGDLYKLEHLYLGTAEYSHLEPMPLEEKHRLRNERSRCVLDNLYEYIEVNIANVQRGTQLHKAMSYSINEKQYIYGFLLDPHIDIDNNFAENAIRPVTVSRKNSLFVASMESGQTHAMYYSVMQTAKLNGLNPITYLVDLFKSEKPIMPWPV